MSGGASPLGVAAAAGLPEPSVTTRARQAAYPRAAVAQVRSLVCRETAGLPWAVDAADAAGTERPATASAAPAVRVRAKRLIEPPGENGDWCSVPDRRPLP